MEQIIDLSNYELTPTEFKKIKVNIRENLKGNVIGYIFTDKIKELYNLDNNDSNKWVIKHDKLLFVFDLVPRDENDENDDTKIIKVRTSNRSNASKIYELLKFKEINKLLLNK
jgi:hypothetical protein